MWKHFLKIAARNLVRNRAYTLINLMGLSTGMATCLIILLFIQFEWDFEGFHPDVDRLYRVAQQFGEDPENKSSGTGVPMGPNLRLAFPEIENVVRIHRKEGLVQIPDKEKRFREPNILYVDSTFFEMFGFELVNGKAEEVLDAPGSVVISERAAIRVFETKEVIGKQLTIDEKITLNITGLAANPGPQTDLDFDLLVNFRGMNTLYNTSKFESWWWPTVETYVKLGPLEDAKGFNSTRAKAFVETYREPGIDIFPALQPIQHIRRYGNPGGKGNIGYIILFGIIGLVVLLIACVNFMNLATARAVSRIMEVGVKKVVGASRGILISQFFGESLLLALLALILGLGLTELMLPFFGRMTGYELNLPWSHPAFWGTLLLLLGMTSFLAGFYPALFMTRFTPLKALKQGTHKSNGGRRLRQGLVIFQFIISATLIASTFLIQQQHTFMLSKKLGYNQEQALVLELEDAATNKSYPALKEALKSIPEVNLVSAASWAPGANYAISFPAEVEDEFGTMNSLEGVNIIYVDYDFFEASGIPIDNGRAFSRDFPVDEREGFILNHAAIEKMGNGPYLDREVRIHFGEYGQTLYEKKGLVRGTIKDFHVVDLRSRVAPTLITLRSENESAYLSHAIIKLHAGDHLHTRSQIEAAWKEVNPGYPVSVYFVDERIEASYAAERRLGYLLGAFATLAIMIACLGLLGLAAFTAQQRTKEIGIRKVLGASTPQILWMLQREFSSLILISLMLSLPLAYFLTQEWLREYPYKVEFSPLPYLLTAVLLISITWISVSLQSNSAAQKNPVDALRYE